MSMPRKDAVDFGENTNSSFNPEPRKHLSGDRVFAPDIDVGM